MRDLEQRIRECEDAMNVARRELERLTAERDRNASVAYIKANGITADNVQLSSGDGVPWHFSARRFGEWLKGSPKRWAEWNGRIYSTAELIDGRVHDSIAYASDVEGLIK